ncbi:MAG: hypothetical protein NWQ46_08115 [Spirosomaceae bacterium]|nr:hypothetical protein [Spirosomataceae bacterium]
MASFFYKFTRYEYWPWWLFYLPMLPYYVYQVIRTGSLTYPTSVNPAIYGGGFYGEKKTDILQHLSSEYLATTIFVEKGSTFSQILGLISEHGLSFPIIAKPNVGERGTDVEKITNETQLRNYADRVNENFLIQEFIDYPIELAVLYSRLPTKSTGEVSSITAKEFLSVTGDGTSTIEQLVLVNPRAVFQLDVLRKRIGDELKIVLPANEKRLLEPIGNHCRGTKFLNGNHLITAEVNAVFDKISAPYENFFYGRYDIKVASLKDFQLGKNIKIMELNGISADPGHVYDPEYKLINAYKDLSWHWKRLADIHLENKQHGHLPMSNREVWGIIKTTFFTNSKTETKPIS